MLGCTKGVGLPPNGGAPERQREEQLVSTSDDRSSLERSGVDPPGGPGWAHTLIWSVLLPPIVFVGMAWLVIVLTNNLDAAYALGISDDLLTGILIGASGLATGLIVAVISVRSGRRLLAPTSVGVFVGLAIYVAFLYLDTGVSGDSAHTAMTLAVWFGISAGVFLAMRLSGSPLVGSILVLTLAGVGGAAIVESIPRPPTEVLLVLQDYAVDDATGVCSGTGTLSEIVAGSHMSLLKYPNADGSGYPEEVGTIVLPTPSEGGGGCLFELGDPLGLSPAEYGESFDFLHESDPDVPYSVSVEGSRLVIEMGG